MLLGVRFGWGPSAMGILEHWQFFESRELPAGNVVRFFTSSYENIRIAPTAVHHFALEASCSHKNSL